MGYLVETSGRVHLPEDLERQAVTVLEVRMAAKQGWFDADDPDQPVSSVSDLAAFAGADARREGEWLVLATDEQGDPKWSDQASEFYRSLADFVREGEVHLRGEDERVWAYIYRDGGVVQRGDNGYDGTPGQLPGPDAFPGTDDDTPAAQTPLDPSPSASDTPPPPPPPPTPPAATEAPAVDPSQFRYPGRQDPAPPPPPPPSGPTDQAGPTAQPTPPPYAGQEPGGPPPHPGYAEQPPPRAPKLPPGWDPERVAEAWKEPAPASPGRTFLMVALLVGGVILIVGLALLVSGM